MKKICCLGLCLMLVFSVWMGVLSLSVQAAGVVIGLSPKKDSYAVGEQVTVSGTVTSGNPIYGVTGSLSYNSAVLQYVSGGSVSAGSEVKITDTECNGETRRGYSITFKVIGEGDCYLKFSAECSDGSTKESGAGGYTIKAAKPVTPPPSPVDSSQQTASSASNNANLASLTVSGATISPNFSADKTAYQASVANEVTSCKITAKAQDGAAKITGTGTLNLVVGNNNRNIVVTAADGTKKTYILTVVRAAEGEQVPEQPDQQTADVLAVKVKDQAYHVLKDVSGAAIPAGMSVVDHPFNGETVQIFETEAKDYQVYRLRNDATGEEDYYTYNKVRDEFQLLPYVNMMGTMYIFAEVKGDVEPPKGYFETSITLGNSEIKAFSTTNPKRIDFYVVYCLVNGKLGFYNYDSLEGTMQRMPDFELTNAQTQPTVQRNDDWVNRIRHMPTRGKIVLITIVLAILCTVALIVLLILRGVLEQRHEKELQYQDYLEIKSSEMTGFQEILPQEQQEELEEVKK
ncbi:MAG: cadherin-like beta sandwich domain-containing protein [Clostridia bacterium]|nr:cadherin-like beta sandwich domain-containing protein [Clostridia bacterium]